MQARRLGALWIWLLLIIKQLRIILTNYVKQLHINYHRDPMNSCLEKLWLMSHVLVGIVKKNGVVARFIQKLYPDALMSILREKTTLDSIVYSDCWRSYEVKGSVVAVTDTACKSEEAKKLQFDGFHYISMWLIDMKILGRTVA